MVVVQDMPEGRSAIYFYYNSLILLHTRWLSIAACERLDLTSIGRLT